MMTFEAKDISLTVDGRGWVRSFSVCGENALLAPSPLLTLCTNDQAQTPAAMHARDTGVTLVYDAGEVDVDVTGGGLCVALAVRAVPEGTDAVVFGPYRVTPDAVVGEVVGVAQRGNIAAGIMSLVPKTVEGLPLHYTDAFLHAYPYDDEALGVTTGAIPIRERAATRLTPAGTALQAFTRDRTREEYAPVMGIDGAWVQPMPASEPDARIAGAAAALYGARRDDVLARIGGIEVEQGLPHPLIEGEWVKTSRKAMRSYLITSFGRQDLDLVLDKAEIAGVKTIYHGDPFETWGHFQWKGTLAESDADFRDNITALAQKRGIAVGLHTLTNFTTTNDGYVTPVPHPNLLKLAQLTAQQDADADTTELLVANHPCLQAAQTLNTLQWGDELLTFTAAEPRAEHTALTGITRGAFGTVPAAHATGEALYLLRDYPYRTLFPDMALQDAFSARLVELFNSTGAAQISYDGLEGCSYTGHDLYAPMRFVARCHQGFDHFVLNDASGLHHYGWHIHTRMNWGEPWGAAMRTGQIEGRIRNQAFFRRNLFPRMLGWFLLRVKDRRFAASTREDAEWAFAKAAGFDAGYAMVADPKVLKGLGNIDQLLSLMRAWDTLREQDAFSEDQKARLRDPNNDFRLERDDEGSMLYHVHRTPEYVCSLGEMQPGQTGGADWSVNNPWAPSFALRLQVDGDGSIRDPLFKTALGTVKYPCTVYAGQFLLVDFDGTAAVTDCNHNVLDQVTPVGAGGLPAGGSALAFAVGESDGEPDVIVTFLTRNGGERVGA